ncbi:MAG: Na/Pi symporter, partial [Lachnospiraceae bacterium]|nr:Na/Pi symporter [Lachnospiraceae bacterium]
MDIFSILELIGGLSLFLYGMTTMGDGLKKASGGKLEIILEKFTANKFMAVILGMVVTAIMQSSSATTVMVVGFVNSGIMALSNAVGVILGASIGATITPWLLSLSSIEGTGTILKLLKPTVFAPVISIIGVAILMFGKKEKNKNVAQVMIGFSVIMFGMSMMSGAAAPLSEVPQFKQLMSMFSNPILGLLVGFMLTAVIQSSSATIGILISLCATGMITYATAIPIVLGANIGTCATAMLSSIGAGKNARRSALIHLYYNIIKSVTFMIIFYSINSFAEFELLNKTAHGTGVALFDTTLSIVAVFLFFPISGLLEKLAYLTIPRTEDENRDDDMKKHISKMLDERFLNTPEFALSQCKTACIEMSRYAKEGLFEAIDMIGSYDEAVAEKVLHYEDLVDHYEDVLDNYFVKLSTAHLSPKSSQQLAVLMHSISDIERISDHAINISDSAKEMSEKELSFSNKGVEEFVVFTQAVKDIVNMTFQIFEDENMSYALNVEPLEELIDDLSVEVRKRHMKRLRKGKCSVEMGFVLADLITNYERISDHCSNIALNVLQTDEEGYDIHEFQENLNAENEDFYKKIDELKDKYKLPVIVKKTEEANKAEEEMKAGDVKKTEESNASAEVDLTGKDSKKQAGKDNKKLADKTDKDSKKQADKADKERKKKEEKAEKEKEKAEKKSKAEKKEKVEKKIRDTESKKEKNTEKK